MIWWPLGRATHSGTATRQTGTLNHQAKQAAPGFHGIISILFPAFMLLLALRLRQQVWKTVLSVVLPYLLWP